MRQTADAFDLEAPSESPLGGGVPNRIRELREELGLSLNELALLAGTTNQQISHLELGKRRLTVEWMVKLAEALRCHPWCLVEPHVASASSPAEEALLALLRRLPVAERNALLVLAEAAAAGA